jgi:uncharacterized Tic20 family protein
MDTKDLLGDESMPAVTPSSDERTLAILSHILCVVVGLGFIPPLVIYLLKKDDSAYVKAHALESLNFQITLLIICLIFIISLIGLLFLWVIGIINLILVIVATIKASENKMYRYPVNFRLVK